jgi:hypothetical protein
MSAWMVEEIEQEATQIREAVAADPVKNSTTAEFEEAVEALTAFARRRPGIVRDYIQIATRRRAAVRGPAR